MRFLANENVPLDAVSALRETGHDIVWVRTDAPGSSDEDILARAVSEERVLVTFDKDFGELAFHSHLPSKCGIMLFRVPESSSAHIARIVTAAVESRSDWTGHFSVVEEYRIRMRPL
jgi:predicted nuclease of predicted toxin-antitoxin system